LSYRRPLCLERHPQTDRPAQRPHPNTVALWLTRRLKLGFPALSSATWEPPGPPPEAPTPRFKPRPRVRRRAPSGGPACRHSQRRNPATVGAPRCDSRPEGPVEPPRRP